jgi:Zn-dependent protease
MSVPVQTGPQGGLPGGHLGARWRLLGVPVFMHLSFPILFTVIGALITLRPGSPHALGMFVLWLPMVTIALLVHELGHALTARAFGLQPFIILHGFGGATTFPAVEMRALSVVRRVLITLAGPFAGIVLGMISLATVLYGRVPHESLAYQALYVFFYVTAGWGFLNLIPILPLDGGVVMADLLEGAAGPRGRLGARLASIAFTVALGALWMGYAGADLFLAFLLGILVYRNWREYRREQDLGSGRSRGQELAQGYAALEEGDVERARLIAEVLSTLPLPEDERPRLGHLLAWSRLLSGDPEGAGAALPGDADALLTGRVHLALGRADVALPLLLEALADRDDDDVADVTADALSRVAGEGPLAAARALAESPRRRLQGALVRRGDASLAATLAVGPA